MDDELLRNFIREAAISASPEYMKKEHVRERLQELIIAAMNDGAFSDEATRETFFADLNLAITTLKMIPFEVWQKL